MRVTVHASRSVINSIQADRMSVTSSARKPRDTDPCASADAFTERCEGTMVPPPRRRMSRGGRAGSWRACAGGGERRRPENLQSRLLLANLAVLAQNPYGCRRKHNSPDQTTARCSHLPTNMKRAMKHGGEQVETRISDVKGLHEKTHWQDLWTWSGHNLFYFLACLSGIQMGFIVDWIPFASPFASVIARLWFISVITPLFHKI